MIDPKFQPFLRFGKFLSEDFLLVAEELMFLVAAYGSSKLNKRPETSAEFIELVAHVNIGWKDAQRRIAELLIDALTRLDSSKENEKEQHRLRDKAAQAEAKHTTSIIHAEIRVLRRMLDTILWTIVQGDHSTLRRLFVEGSESNLSIKNINDAMPSAEQINENPLNVAICTDMLSIVHIGDLLVVDHEKRKIRFVELKAGEKNYEMSKAAAFSVESECSLFDTTMAAAFDQKDAKHFERLKRQAKRNKTIIKTIQNEEGFDQNTGARVHISPLEEAPQAWNKEIVKCYEQLTETKNWAITTVEGCIHLGVYTDQSIAFVGFQSWMDRLKCESKIYNLTDSFLDPWVRPLAATFLPMELKNKILRGDVLVIICLDIEKMIQLANRARKDFLSLVPIQSVPRESSRGHRLLKFKDSYVQMDIDGKQSFIGAGMGNRIIFDQQNPFQLLAHFMADNDTFFEDDASSQSHE